MAPASSGRQVHTRASRGDLRAALAALPGDAAAAHAVLIRVGLAALANIRRAFVVKARGGTDEAGDRWQPLSPRTVAYGRRHPGLAPAGARAAKRPSAALTARQRERWWGVYRQSLARFRGNKAAAARMAWVVLKRAGAQTILSRHGGASAEILRDTGLLLNSLSPGAPGNGGAAQVLRTSGGAVIVGTNRAGAAAHHRGAPGRGLPQRRLWPRTESWPEAWWGDILDVVKTAVLDMAVQAARGQ